MIANRIKKWIVVASLIGLAALIATDVIGQRIDSSGGRFYVFQDGQQIGNYYTTYHKARDAAANASLATGLPAEVRMDPVTVTATPPGSPAPGTPGSEPDPGTDPDPGSEPDVSAEGTTIPPAERIVDRLGDVWTLGDDAKVYRNGEPADFTADVVSLTYSNDQVIQTNADGASWYWYADAWLATAEEPGAGSGGGGDDDPVVIDPSPFTPSSFLAMNVDEPMYWARSWVFVDVMKQATWREGAQAFIAFNDSDGHFPGGSVTGGSKAYTVVPAEAATVNVGNKLTIVPGAGFEDGNFSVYMPGFAPGEPGNPDGQQLFHPLYLDRLKPFKTIRFMQWQQTNNQNEWSGKWPNRIKPGDKRGDDKLSARVPIEYMVDLCNALGADPWFCMPDTADADYVRNFATLVRDRLHGDATIYVEFSNELWNSPFGQSKRMRDVSGAIDHDRWAAKIQLTRDIWRGVFGDEADRVIVVLAGQETNPWHTEQLAERLAPGWLDGDASGDASGGTSGGRHFDAIATTAYFKGEGIGIDAVFEDIRGKRRDRRMAQGKIARDYGVPYLTYEAGPHDLQNDQSWHDTDRMYDAMIENMKVFEEAGGSLYNAFLFVGPNNQWGYWGHLEYMDVPLADAPKYRALVEFGSESEIQ